MRLSTEKTKGKKMDTDFQDNMCNLVDLLNSMDLDQPDLDDLEKAISLASDLQRAYDEMS